MFLQEWGFWDFFAGVLRCPSAATGGKPYRYSRGIRRVGRGVGFNAGDVESMYSYLVDVVKYSYDPLFVSHLRQ